MVFVIVIVTVVLGISLYDYFSSRDVNALTSSTLLFKNRNKRYGAFVLRQSYAPVMLGVTLSALVLFGLSVGAHYGTRGMGDWHSKYEVKEIVDTTLLSLETPPKDQPPVPEAMEIKSDQGNQGKNESDQEELQEVKDPTRSNDNSNDPNQSREKPQENQKVDPKTIQNDIQAMDSYFQGVSKDAAARAEARRKKNEERQKAQQQQTSAGKNQKGSEEKKGTSGAYVTHNFSDRKDLALPVAAFKCEEGGVIVVNVVLDAYGNVTEAKIAPAYAGKPQCLKEEALMYANRSRFSASSRQSQSGALTYTFKAQ